MSTLIQTSQTHYPCIWHYKSVRGTTKRVSLEEIQTPPDYNQYFSDIDYGHRKYLECQVNNLTLTFAENVAIPFRNHFFSEPDLQNLRVSIVYFANTIVNRSHGSKLICQNIEELLSCKIIENVPNCHVHIVLSIHSRDVLTQVKRVIPLELVDKFTFHVTFSNDHEYPGILKVHEMGHTSDVILYFHSKNMTRYRGQPNYHDPIGDKLLQDIVKNWRYCLFILHNFDMIDKVVSTCSPEGWGWFNYWWIRGSYMKSMNPPQKTTNRWYYESWLAREYIGTRDKIVNCWSVSTTPSKGYFNLGTKYEWFESPFQTNIVGRSKQQTDEVMRKFPIR